MPYTEAPMDRPVLENALWRSVTEANEIVADAARQVATSPVCTSTLGDDDACNSLLGAVDRLRRRVIDLAHKVRAVTLMETSDITGKDLDDLQILGNLIASEAKALITYGSHVGTWHDILSATIKQFAVLLGAIVKVVADAAVTIAGGLFEGLGLPITLAIGYVVFKKVGAA